VFGGVLDQMVPLEMKLPLSAAPMEVVPNEAHPGEQPGLVTGMWVETAL
jgi:hypothetical protein